MGRHAGTGEYDERPWLAWYPRGVPHEIKVRDIGVTALLDEAVQAFPDRTAVAYLGATLTYRELASQVASFSAALAALGVGKGDRVAIILPNCPQNVVAFFAGLRIGAVVVQHNPLYTEPELRHQLSDSGAVVAIVHDAAYGRLAAIRDETELRHVITTSLVDYLPRRRKLMLGLPVRKAREMRERLQTPIPEGAPVLDFVELLRARHEPVPPATIHPDENLALLQYTGGTTGAPKGAMLSHRNLVANAFQTRAWDPGMVEGRETTLAVLPLFHVYGLTLCLTTTILAGGTLVLLPTFDVDLVLDAIRERRPTVFPGVPPMYDKLLDSDRIGDVDLRSIRTCVSGAMRLPPQTVDRFQALTGGRLVEGYGLTESAPVVVANPLNANARAGTVGIPVPGTEVRVVDEHANDPTLTVPIGVAGELAVRGPQVFQGYWKHAGESAAMVHDGWLLTGDIAVMSPDGFVTIIDRKRDIVMVSGFSVFPSEVEDALRGHPDIADIAVLGVPDPFRGELVKACVVPREGAQISPEDVRAYGHEQLVAYKVPRLVELRSELPRNLLGKPLRRVLREEHERGLVGGDAPRA
jgi:long-chain acyl-CoA synthetase